MIKSLIIGDLMIDCGDAERSRDFYADLMGWEKTTAYDCPALTTSNGMTILFANMTPDVPFVQPVWPEEPDGEQQKQMHLDFTVDDVQPVVDKAIRLGATKAAIQYGGDQLDQFITMLDIEGRPFCMCKRQPDTEFEKFFHAKGYDVIPNPSINIDCRKTETLREFYANLTSWDQDFHWSALIAENGMVVHFMQCDFDYIPPVWPEEQGKQQKQMHFNFQVDDLDAAVAEAVRLGAIKTAAQFGGDHFVTLIDTEGHPFCLCSSS